MGYEIGGGSVFAIAFAWSRRCKMRIMKRLAMKTVNFLINFPLLEDALRVALIMFRNRGKIDDKLSRLYWYQNVITAGNK